MKDLHRWLNTRLGDAIVIRATGAQVARFALALDPADLPADLEADALFLHRSFRLGDRLPHLSVIASHDGFDAALTTGQNLPLARALGWQDVQPIMPEEAAGLLGTPPQTHWPELLAALATEFGGYEALLEPPDPQVSRLAFMNAMQPALLTAVAAQGAQVYVTGQMRPGALPRARELGLGVVALGHRRTELWGLRQLARDLQTAFPGLECRIYGEA